MWQSERERTPMKTSDQHPLQKILENRIAIIDGAMGTTIRTYGMKEADIRGERFKDSTKDLLNNGDLFSLTQPDMICDIHRRFLEAGADIIETNTFGATSITQSEFFVDDPREHGGRKDPEFYQKIRSWAAWPGRSTRDRRSSAASGLTGWATQPAVNASWRARLGR
jgi:5-methyltetrahydrofolate--homocysteine methyltransferase